MERRGGLPVLAREGRLSKGMDQLKRRYMGNSRRGGGEGRLFGAFLISFIYTAGTGKELRRPRRIKDRFFMEGFAENL
jgi:hypothetical protein